MHFTEIQRADLIDRIRRLSRPMSPRPTGHPPSGRAPSGIRAVVFDLYGTLFVSGAGEWGQAETGSASLFAEAAASAGFMLDLETASALSARYQDEVMRRHAARRAEGIACPEVDVRHVWRAVLEAAAPKARLSDEAIVRFAVEVECRVNPVWPMPELRETLARLARRGICLGIVSNAQCFTPLLFDALLGARLEALGFAPAYCAWSWRLGEAKPSPRLLHHVLTSLREEHGIQPQETLVVGNDMLNDMLPAQAAGCATALFAGDARSLRLRADDPRCRDIVPTLTLVSLDAL